MVQHIFDKSMWGKKPEFKIKYSLITAHFTFIFIIGLGNVRYNCEGLIRVLNLIVLDSTFANAMFAVHSIVIVSILVMFHMFVSLQFARQCKLRLLIFRFYLNLE